MMRAGSAADNITLVAAQLVDISRIGALARLLQRVGVCGEAALCGLSESVMQMFRVARMNRVFAFHSDSSHAVEGLGG